MAGQHPGAIREVILRRLSRLSDPCQQILSIASVIGRDFDLALLRQLCPEIAEQEFMEALDEGLGLRIAEALPTDSERYRFSHALIQQAVYEEIPPLRKAGVHATIANALEQTHQADLDQHAAELAHHFARAGAVAGAEKVVMYSLIAGERALASFAYEQAVVHFGRIVDANDGGAVEADLAQALFGLGRAQAATLPRQESLTAHNNLVRAFDYYVEAGDTPQIAAIAGIQILPLSELGVSTGILLERALELVPESTPEAGRLYANFESLLSMERGDYSGAQDYFQRALEIGQKVGDPAVEMWSLIQASRIDCWHLHFQQSLERGLKAAEIAENISDLKGAVAGRYWASLAARANGDAESLRLLASGILEPAQQLRDRYWLSSAYQVNFSPPIFEGD
jgi:tetratricopeptide (TPR) repeat protein